MTGNIRTQPFTQSKAAEQLPAGLLTSVQFRQAIAGMPKEELPRFVRTFIEEGTPAIFYRNPLLWETIRDWLSRRMKVSPKSIGLVGSARTGFSCAPSSFGRPFSARSDLDLSIVDGDLFALITRDARVFCGMIEADRLVGRSPFEHTLWKENVRVLSTSIRLGFVDPNKIPALHDRFPTAANALNEASILIARLHATPGYVTRRASFRIYDSWSSVSRRLTLNLRALLSE